VSVYTCSRIGPKDTSLIAAAPLRSLFIMARIREEVRLPPIF